ncbi:MAG: hypothetical protein DMG05_28550, partial [Acidobacteria bacterium]
PFVCHIGRTNVEVARELMFDGQIPLLRVSPTIGVEGPIVYALAIAQSGIDKGRALEVLWEALAKDKGGLQTPERTPELRCSAESFLGYPSVPSGIKGLGEENPVTGPYYRLGA